MAPENVSINVVYQLEQNVFIRIGVLFIITIQINTKRKCRYTNSDYLRQNTQTIYPDQTLAGTKCI